MCLFDIHMIYTRCFLQYTYILYMLSHNCIWHIQYNNLCSTIVSVKKKLAYIVWYTHIGYNVCAHICAHMIIWSVSHHYLMRRIHVCMHSPNPHPKIQVKSFSQTFNEHPKIHRSFWKWSSLLIHGLSKLIQAPRPPAPSLDRYIDTYMYTCRQR